VSSDRSLLISTGGLNITEVQSLILDEAGTALLRFAKMEIPFLKKVLRGQFPNFSPKPQRSQESAATLVDFGNEPGVPTLDGEQSLGSNQIAP